MNQQPFGPILLILIFALASVATAATAPPPERFRLEIEAQAVWQTDNDVQIPNDDSGTRFSLTDLIGAGPYAGLRIYFTWNITNRHGLRALLAPLRITGTGTSDVPIDFAGQTFAAGQPIDATYIFNSWRVTYAYRFVDTPKWGAWVGFTAKLRDAEIALEQNGTEANDTDLGFVPLLHLAGSLRLSDRVFTTIDFDGLAGGPGRAIDAALKVGYDVSEVVDLSLGYRTLEGGADVNEVYNFAWLNYLVGSVMVRF